MKTAVSLLVASLLALPASGQVIGRIPEATPPTPDYTPPAPVAPAPPPKPAEPEKPLPSLVIKDADGKLKAYPQGVERAAIAAFEFDADTTRKIAASEEARNADIERMIVEKLDKLKDAKATRDRLNDIKDFNEFAKIKDVAAPLATEKLSDRLMRDGALNAMQRSRVDQVVKQYETTLREQWQQQTGSDILKIASLVAKEKFTEVTSDAFGALDRLLLRLAPSLAAAEPDLKLTAQQKPQFDAAVTAASGSDPARIDSLRSWFFSDLTPDQQKTLLTRGLPQAPAAK